MLAYLFWHSPRGPDQAAYEDALARFHASLAAAPPAGFERSFTLRLDRPAPWWQRRPAYLDFYVVADFAALGILNEAAVSGARSAPHDAAAAMAADGTAGVARLVAGSVDAPPARLWAGFAAKPAGEPYKRHHAALAAALPAGAGAWMRQMTLGPGSEFLVLAGAPCTLPGTLLHASGATAVGG